MTTDRHGTDGRGGRSTAAGEVYAAARAQLTKPARGEWFETDAADDGSAVFRMFTKLQTPEKGWSGLAVPSEFLGLRRRVWLRGTARNTCAGSPRPGARTHAAVASPA
jgi:hypothetical protein